MTETGPLAPAMGDVASPVAVAARNVRHVREDRKPGDPPIFGHPEWTSRFPWMVQGTTGKGDEPEACDFGLGSGSAAALLRRWRLLRESMACDAMALSTQVHGAAVRVHERASDGMFIAHARDGHATAVPGLLLAVSIADCVPVFVAAPARPAVAVLHAGWRGVAAGVLESGVATLTHLADAAPADLHVHLGPAICGACYEVGPEVPAALGMPPSDAAVRLDLRSVLAARGLALGIPASRITRSEHCTRCDGSPFYSHRRGERGRQLAVIGIRG